MRNNIVRTKQNCLVNERISAAFFIVQKCTKENNSNNNTVAKKETRNSLGEKIVVALKLQRG